MRTVICYRQRAYNSLISIIMSAFKELREVSLNFQQELRRTSDELLSAKTGETFEEGIAKKMRDLSLYSAKLKLLHAKSLSVTPQITEQPSGEDTIHEYGEVASSKVLEQVVVKGLTRSQAIKTLLCTPNSKLEAELIDRKQQIVDAISLFHQRETELTHMTARYDEKQAEYDRVSQEWDGVLGELRDMRDEACEDTEPATKGPLYKKMSNLVDKLEIMRHILGRLATERGRYDWLSDPDHRLKALKLARHVNTVDMFTSTH